MRPLPHVTTFGLLIVNVTSIIARLRQDGFGAEVDFLTPTHFKQYNVVWRAKKLTEGGAIAARCCT